MGIIHLVLAFLRAFFASRAVLAAENAMLRQQLIVVHRGEGTLVSEPELAGSALRTGA